ncbi:MULTISPECIES: hypothetical protein [unclassified Mesorhizobium]|nr:MULTISPECIES: hypothetical protein [unclassified Mesorhizobium]TPJ45773.1 hypothetical protein FJ437_16250 [Mesorhizobium sp. B2-6-6]TPL29691.1 hypothetical protein FJ947_25650 [Mesorhizobium sp. B2-4-8]TPL68440.1 hypothetical protein FJ949_04925 [Mesorhizobium sp. B2-4-1]MBZ9703769.1 hypothetical protein [Mesorhizobium sp. CO1-1-3]MBZ9897648.1 hypothetical protein [Mesorhizobium sp. BR1-1-6]
MYKKLFAAFVLTAGLATSAMAQSTDGRYYNHDSWWNNWSLFGNEDSSAIDQSTTGSINAYGSGLSTQGNTGGMGPCAHNTPGPDANAQGNVNDQYCGK